ncbi:hypothetical protein ACLOJK_028369 [Asimina triloba]
MRGCASLYEYVRARAWLERSQVCQGLIYLKHRCEFGLDACDLAHAWVEDAHNLDLTFETAYPVRGSVSAHAGELDLKCHIGRRHASDKFTVKRGGQERVGPTMVTGHDRDQ